MVNLYIIEGKYSSRYSSCPLNIICAPNEEFMKEYVQDKIGFPGAEVKCRKICKEEADEIRLKFEVNGLVKKTAR